MKEWSMVGLVGSHDLLNCKDSCFSVKFFYNLLNSLK